MRSLLSMIAIESKKLSRSYVVWGMLALYLFICAIRVGEGDWSTYLGNVLFMFASVLGLVGYAALTSWTYGREYNDRTFKDLLALPVSRGKIVAGKAIASLAWCLLLTGTAFAFSLLIGMLAGISGLTGELIIYYSLRLLIIAIIQMLLCGPVILLASLSRGYLVPIAYAFTTLIVALIVGATPLGHYMPWVIPSLQYAGSEEALLPLSLGSYLIPVLTGLAGFVATWAWWRWADHK
ncbi:ABC transporter permease [Paenibacillus brevis]|uniref:ABC transporter permease n=1 Tax=Paenibacillus brevis TaxID=2841508 RepID=A0ABS6FLK1_9BACL|nr:ABC transporter permease [Paenibacillus brevis]MBU5671079.1 ABC transporter permease [Paenibacillus brevis]